MASANARGMAAKIEDLPIYARATEFCVAVNTLLERPALRRNSRLRGQIEEANDSIIANMHEGFEQPTDRAFANYLTYAKASLAEVLGRLQAARSKQYLTEEELTPPIALGEELGKMLGGFIKYLQRSDFKDRGRFCSRG